MNQSGYSASTNQLKKKKRKNRKKRNHKDGDEDDDEDENGDYDDDDINFLASHAKSAADTTSNVPKAVLTQFKEFKSDHLGNYIMSLYLTYNFF